MGFMFGGETDARTVPAKPFTIEGTTFDAAVRRETDAIADMLIAKNAAYGNSALDPLRVFSSADPAEAIRVRIDDKLSRLARGSAAGEDTTKDLLGYLVLLRIAEAGE